MIYSGLSRQLVLIIIGLLLSACGPGQLFGPTITPTPTHTPTKTPTITPTMTLTPTETPSPTLTSVPTETPTPTETSKPLVISELSGVWNGTTADGSPFRFSVERGTVYPIRFELEGFTVERKQIIACGQIAFSTGVITSGPVENSKFAMSFSGFPGVPGNFGVLIEGTFTSETSASGTFKFSCTDSTTWTASNQ